MTRVGDWRETARPDVIAFRSRILDAVASDLNRFYYLSRDLCVAVCPCCDPPLAIAFAGTAPGADLACCGGRAEREPRWRVTKRRARRYDGVTI